jgi:hypothetical protein
MTGLDLYPTVPATGDRSVSRDVGPVRDAAEVTEFSNQDLTGSAFSHVDLSRASFNNIDFTGATFRDVDLIDVDIKAHIEGLRINDVDIEPLVQAELDRRHPLRSKMRPTDAAGFREAWNVVEELWQGTVAKAQALDPQLLHQRVDGEWSFTQTLRHLVFATDAWVARAILGDPSPWDALDLPYDQMAEIPEIPWDREVQPTLEDVLRLRSERMAMVRRVITDLTDEGLDAMTEPVLEPGYPQSESFPVRGCLRCILNEEWEHRLYAERDLAALS